jgi:hypothetical protein
MAYKNFYEKLAKPHVATQSHEATHAYDVPSSNSEECLDGFLFNPRNTDYPSSLEKILQSPSNSRIF